MTEDEAMIGQYVLAEISQAQGEAPSLVRAPSGAEAALKELLAKATFHKCDMVRTLGSDCPLCAALAKCRAAGLMGDK